LPPHPLDIYEITHWGVMAIRYLTVFLFLYDDHVCAFAFKFDGCFIAISKQSIITATEL